MKYGLLETYIDRNGNTATRYWVHPQIMVGGSILTSDDWQHLRRDYGLTGVLSVESQESLEGEWVHVRKHLPFEDDGASIPAHIVLGCIEFAREQLADPSNRLYVHCALGGARSPSIAYAIGRAVLGWKPEHALAIIRAARPEFGHWRKEIIDSYLASIEAALSLPAASVTG